MHYSIQQISMWNMTLQEKKATVNSNLIGMRVIIMSPSNTRLFKVVNAWKNISHQDDFCFYFKLKIVGWNNTAQNKIMTLYLPGQI